MILRQLALLVAALGVFSHVAVAEPAPEITVAAEGYNVIAKVPCVGCAFLYHDTSKGKDEGWLQRKDENALLLNISLPFDSSHLSINNGALLTSSKTLPKIYANQILLDTSKEDLAELIASNQIDDHGGGYFGVSYTYSVLPIKSSRAVLFRFDIMELWSDLPRSPLTIVLDDAKQKILEIVLLQRPIMSPGDPSNAFEIIRAELVPRPENEPRSVSKQVMWFQDYDSFGKKGTTLHLVNSASDSMIAYISSSIWSLVIVVVSIVVTFVGICLCCFFALGLHRDEYEMAQKGKKRRKDGTWGSIDVEKARRFMTPEELGLRSGGRIVGVGKRD